MTTSINNYRLSTIGLRTTCLKVLCSVLSAIGFTANATSQDSEPNNDLASANPIGLGQTVNGQVSFPADGADYFSFLLDEDGALLVTASVSAPVGWSAYVYMGNEYGGNWINQTIPDTGGTWLVGSRRAGTYHIRVQPVPLCCAQVNYTFSIQFSKPQFTLGQSIPNDPEPNNVQTLALPIQANAINPLSGHLYYLYPPEPADNYDYYKVRLDSIGDVAIHVHDVAANFELVNPSIVMELIDSVTQIQLATSGQDFVSDIYYQTLDSGTYYIWLRTAIVGCGYEIDVKHYTEHMELWNHQEDQSTYLTYSSPTTPRRFKLCADGSKATQLWYSCDTCTFTNNLRMRLRSNLSNGTSAEFGGIYDDPGDYDWNSTGVVKAWLTHPQYMNASGSFRLDTLEVYDLFSGTVLFRNEIEIYRAPVLFVHGLGGKASAFRSLADGLVLADKFPFGIGLGQNLSLSPIIRLVDYHAHSTDYFSVNRHVIRTGIEDLIQSAVDNQYSAGSVTLVGHSMGGILGRLWLQSSYGMTQQEKQINKLITVNTPHAGTQSANFLMDSPWLRSLFVAQLLGHSGPDGAIRDLCVNSNATAHVVNADPSLLSANSIVPAVTLSTDSTGDVSEEARQVRSMLQLFAGNLYSGMANDVIVPVFSQQCGIQLQNTIQGQWHGGSPDNAAIQAQVAQLIDADPTGSAFWHDNFPIGTLTYDGMASQGGSHTLQSRDAETDSVVIVTPISDQVFNPLDLVDVTIQHSAQLTHLALLINGASITPITNDPFTGTQVSFQIPASAQGLLNVMVLGGDTSGWLASDMVAIEVLNSVPPDSIVCSPASTVIPLGLPRFIEVLCHQVGNSQPINIESAPSLSFDFDPDYLQSLGNGVFRAIATGTTQIAFEYQGSVDTVTVSIVDQPSALTAAFDYPFGPLCQGSAANFHDISLGLTSGFEWVFPGGLPSTSSDPNPIVTYSNPGVYGVSLITTFVNGSDTLVLDSLIEVLAIDTSVTLNDGTLLAGAPEATYQWLDCSDGFAPIANATDSAFTPTTNGLYALAVTQGVCTDTSACYLVLTTGVDSYDAEGATILPNPNDGTFVLEFAATNSTVLVEITDMTGRVVHRERAQNTRCLNIQLEGSAGSYMVNVTTPEKHFVLPLVKR